MNELCQWETQGEWLLKSQDRNKISGWHFSTSACSLLLRKTKGVGKRNVSIWPHHKAFSKSIWWKLRAVKWLNQAHSSLSCVTDSWLWAVAFPWCLGNVQQISQFWEDCSEDLGSGSHSNLCWEQNLLRCQLVLTPEERMKEKEVKALMKVHSRTHHFARQRRTLAANFQVCLKKNKTVPSFLSEKTKKNIRAKIYNYRKLPNLSFLI